MRRLAATILALILCSMMALWGVWAQPATAQNWVGGSRVQHAQLATATPFPPPTTGAGGSPAVPITYVVQPGDNLYRLALRFGTTIQALIAANSLSDAGALLPGQVLVIPPGPIQPPVLPIEVPSNVPFSFGLVAGGRSPSATLSSLRDLGVQWVKLTLDWSKFEPAPGMMAPDQVRAIGEQIDALSSANVKILLTITNAPDWARSPTGGPLLDEGYGPPADFSTYAEFVGTLATNFQGRVAAYEIWEQPNIRSTWSGAPLNGLSYVELLRLAYAAIKRADPGALVVSAGLAPTGLNDGVNAVSDRVYLQQMYNAGLAEVSDAIGAQPDGWANPPDSSCCSPSPGVSGWFNDRSFYFRDTLADYRQIMVQNNDGSTLIWVTRFGWGSSESVVPDPLSVNPALGFVNFTSQTEQAQYVARGFEIGRTLGYVGPMFLYNLDRCAGAESLSPADIAFEPCYFALLDSGGNPRPAYEAVKTARK